MLEAEICQSMPSKDIFSIDDLYEFKVFSVGEPHCLYIQHTHD